MQVLSTRKARIKGCFRILAIDLLAPDNDSALIGANQLVGAEQNHVRPGLDGFADGRFVRQPELLQIQQRARSEIINHQQILAVRQLGQLGERHFAGETDDAVIARMHAHERGGLLRDGVAIILEVRPVGRAHFDQPRPALRHHIGQPE